MSRRWRWRPSRRAAIRTCWPRRPASARTRCRASRRCSTSRRSPTSSSWRAPDTFVRPIYAGSVLATVSARRRDQGHHRPRDRLRRGARDRRQCRDRRRHRGAGHRPVAGDGTGAVEVRAPGAHQRAHRDLRRPRARQRREFQAARSARRQAQRGARRVARGGRRRLRAQRIPGGPDRQDRRARSLHRRRAFPARSSISPA